MEFKIIEYHQLVLITGKMKIDNNTFDDALLLVQKRDLQMRET